jgi:hypothetical protein
MRRLLLALAACLAFGAADARAATVSLERPGGHGRAGHGGVVTCDQAIEPFGPARHAVTVGGVVFRDLRDAASRRFDATRLFRSTVSVPGGKPVTVSVAQSWLSLRYGAQRNDGRPLRVSDGARRLTLRPCANATSWAGGFIVSRPGCATLRVNARRVRVGFGRRC